MITELSKDLLEKYSVSVPRYTSYPPTPEWTTTFTQDDFLTANEITNQKQTPASLYFHLPFCKSRCYFCACNVVISEKNSIVKPYLEHIKKEVKRLSKNINSKRKVYQIHLGGGTPTYFQPDELRELFSIVKDSFNISKTCEASVEVDPRVTSIEHLKALSELGFNRLSMGIQDFDLKVQSTVNRIQTFEQTKNIFNWSRELRFESINVDLIYGLPHQTKESFTKTIELILKLNPDRIAFFHYAHLPMLVPHQRKYIQEAMLPASSEKIEIFKFAVDKLTSNGYIFIGLDHFAKTNNELALARKDKTLHRNFQGYTTKSGCDLYGFGITAISSVENIYSQNIKKLNPYYLILDSGNMPISRGIILSIDDLIRKDIIMKMLCHGVVEKSEIEEKYNIKFDKYFSSEVDKLKELERDDLIFMPKVGKSRIEVTGLGQFFLRNIASIFDSYYQRKNEKQRIYSKSI